MSTELIDGWIDGNTCLNWYCRLISRNESKAREPVFELASEQKTGNLVDSTCISALAHAAKHGDTTTISHLLSFDADPNGYPVGGFPPLVIGGRHTEVLRLLLDAGANVDCQNRDGQTALMHAAGSGNHEAVAVLVAANANPTLTDKAGHRASDYAKLLRNDAVYRQLT